MYGFEGEYYELTDERISFSATADNPYPNFWPRYAGAFKDVDLIPPLVSNPPGYKEQLLKLMRNSRDSSTLGFRWEMDELLRDITIKRNEAFEQLEKDIRIKGAVIDVDKFIKDRMDAGANILAQELQRQLYEWKNKQ